MYFRFLGDFDLTGDGDNDLLLRCVRSVRRVRFFRDVLRRVRLTGDRRVLLDTLVEDGDFLALLFVLDARLLDLHSVLQRLVVSLHTILQFERTIYFKKNFVILRINGRFYSIISQISSAFF